MNNPKTERVTSPLYVYGDETLPTYEEDASRRSGECRL
jgi:hypothetical protein